MVHATNKLSRFRPISTREIFFSCVKHWKRICERHSRRERLFRVPVSRANVVTLQRVQEFSVERRFFEALWKKKIVIKFKDFQFQRLHDIFVSIFIKRMNFPKWFIDIIIQRDKIKMQNKRLSQNFDRISNYLV